MLKKKPVVGPLRITFVFTFFWWSKHFRFAMEMLSDTVCAVPSSLTHRYCLLFLFLCQTLLFIFVELYLLSNLASSAVLLFCPHFVHYSFAWQTCYKESLEGLAEDGGTQWLHYSSGDKAQRQGNENLFTVHKLDISSWFYHNLPGESAGAWRRWPLWLGNANFQLRTVVKGNISDCTASTHCNQKFSNVQALTETPDTCSRKTWLLVQGNTINMWWRRFLRMHSMNIMMYFSWSTYTCVMTHENWTSAPWVTRATWPKNSMREPLNVF